MGGQFSGVTFSGFVDRWWSQPNVGAGGPHWCGSSKAIRPLSKLVARNEVGPQNVAASNRVSPETFPANRVVPKNFASLNLARPENFAP